jgi:hypothetical protein
MTAEIDKMERLLARVIEEGAKAWRVSSIMRNNSNVILHWTIPLELKEEIEQEVYGVESQETGDTDSSQHS